MLPDACISLVICNLHEADEDHNEESKASNRLPCHVQMTTGPSFGGCNFVDEHCITTFSYPSVGPAEASLQDAQNERQEQLQHATRQLTVIPQRR